MIFEWFHMIQILVLVYGTFIITSGFTTEFKNNCAQSFVCALIYTSLWIKIAIFAISTRSCANVRKYICFLLYHANTLFNAFFNCFLLYDYNNTFFRCFSALKTSIRSLAVFYFKDSNTLFSCFLLHHASSYSLAVFCFIT